jgi:hypothetical protein
MLLDSCAVGIGLGWVVRAAVACGLVWALTVVINLIFFLLKDFFSTFYFLKFVQTTRAQLKPSFLSLSLLSPGRRRCPPVAVPLPSLPSLSHRCRIDHRAQHRCLLATACSTTAPRATASPEKKLSSHRFNISKSTFKYFVLSILSIQFQGACLIKMLN